MIPRLAVIHYHLRPGGVRRVIELALPAIANLLGVRRITLATGEAAEAGWIELLRAALPGVELRERVEPGFCYASEQRAVPKRLPAAVDALLADADAVWLHNPALARNLPLVEAVAAAVRARDIPMVFHHHDFWFENRWARHAGFRAHGYHSLDAVARAIFPADAVHVSINRFDHRVLRRAFGRQAVWMPNPAGRRAPPAQAKIRAAKRWLREQLGGDAPVWIVPTRLLRRKNLAEAVLITRWLRPDAWTITTAAVSSPGEHTYARRLDEAARRHGWRVRFAIRSGNGSDAPEVASLVAASEVMLLTSVQEGFGLPYLESVEAGKPLIARALPNVLPDLRRFGFRLPQLYDEVWIDPACFDALAERRRQLAIWRRWRDVLPAAAGRIAERSAFLAARLDEPVAFSRLTLSAQLEILAMPPGESWAACARLNPRMAGWRRGALRAAPWPESADAQIGPEAYARRFARALGVARVGVASESAAAAQREFISQRLGSGFMFPILMEE
ncbi:MAG: glycosyltransferase [Terrimicrobiaceae bacterium]|nr:glycosyltransferase [Terrimicrobiaceae bacterium]